MNSPYLLFTKKGVNKGLREHSRMIKVAFMVLPTASLVLPPGQQITHIAFGDVSV